AVLSLSLHDALPIFGLLRAVHSLQAVPVLARLLYPVAAVVMLTLAVVSFLDFRRAGRGETGQIALQLPRSIKLRIHQIIRTRMRDRKSTRLNSSHVS